MINSAARLVLFMVIFSGQISAKSVIVSQTNISKNGPGCGTKTQPCQTIKYAIDNIARDGDIVFIDGGCNSYTYNIDETIIIDHHITITALKHDQKCNYPLIKGTKTMTTPPGFILFEVRSNLNISFIRHTMVQSFNGYSYIFSLNKTSSSIVIQVSDSDFSQLFFGILTFVTQNNTVTFERCNLSEIHSGPIAVLPKVPGNHVILNQSHLRNVYVTVPQLFVGFEEVTFLDTIFNGVQLYEQDQYSGYSLSLINCYLNNTELWFFYANSTLFHNITIGQESWITVERTTYVDVWDVLFTNNYRMTSTQYLMTFFSVQNVNVNGLILIDSLSQIVFEIQDSHLNMNVKIEHAFHDYYQKLQMQHTFGDDNGVVIFSLDRTNPFHITDPNGLTRWSTKDKYLVSCSPNFRADFIVDNAVSPNLYSSLCVPLPSQYYTLAESKVYLNETNQKFSTPQNTQIQKCPFEAHCGDGQISNKELYWGMVNDNISFVNSYGDSVYGSSITFFPCPELYCCPINENCNGGFDSCSRGRKGTLCGDCKDGFVVPIIGHGCMPELNCDVINFVVVFFILTPVWLLMVKYARVLIEKVLLIGKRLRAGVDRGRRDPEPDRNQAQEHDEHIGYILDEPCGDGGRMSPIVGQPPNRPINENDDVDIFIASLMEIVFVFYQVAYTMRVKTAQRIKHQESLIIDILTIPFTGSIDATPPANQYCAALTRDAFAIEAVKIGPLFFGFCILLAVIALFQMKEWIGKFRRRVNNGEREPLLRYQQLDQNTPNYDGRRKPLDLQLSEWYLNFMFIAYLPFALFLLKIINCWSGFTDESLSYLQSSVSCFSRPCQAIALFVFIFIWVPVPLAVYFATKLLRACKINTSQFLVALTFPPSIIWYFVKRENGEGLTRKQISFTYHFLQIIDGGYRKWKPEENQPMQWKPALITRALIIALLINIDDPFVRLTTFGLVFLIFIIFESTMKPYKDKTLNTLSINSWVLLMMLAIFNLFWLFTGVTGIEKSDVLSVIGYLLLVGEIILLLLPFLSVIFYILGCLVYRTVQKYLMGKQN